MRVRGSIEPLEWDYISSKTTVYQRTNIVKIDLDDGHSEWEYDEIQMSFDEFYDTIYWKRIIKLGNLSGKCSGAIYAGRDISAKHYNFGVQAQDNIKGMLIEVQNGKTAFLYGADGEQLSTHTAAQISELGQVMGEWINVNTAYYEQLKIWVGRETDVPALTALHYGSALPEDLMQLLGAKLAAVGIDVRKYAGMFA